MARRRLAVGEQPLHWVRSSRKDLLGMPEAVRHRVGVALGVAQYGGKHPDTKSWRGEGPGVFEVATTFDGSAYRAVYVVRFPRAVYVLHCFQKKSPHGIRTPGTDVKLVGARLRVAREHYERHYDEAEESSHRSRAELGKRLRRRRFV